MNTSIDEKSSAALISNAAVEKLVEFAKSKRFITWDDVIEYLGQEFVNSDELMEPVLKQLKDINREPVETDIIGAEDVTDDALVDDDEDEDGIMLEDDDDDVASDDETAEIEQAEKKLAASKNRLVNSDKDSSVDDPIRLYLREIGKENLLTAEQEVELSKTMEQGNNIIKDVIKNSGIIIPEFFAIAQKA
ncbi:MAG: sigma-70 factor domain-containing protein, partial [Treponema sp.]|nr:sigma-70 factor domain-containing protein [Treponema sp.]